MSTTSKLRLNKKRLRALETALSLDDVLFEKFRRLHEELNRREAAYWRKKQIVSVIGQRGKFNYHLQVIDVLPSNEGTQVLVRLPEWTR